MTADSPGQFARFDWRATLARMESPTAPYYLLLGATSLLTVFGLIMVLSASSVTSYQSSGSSYTVFLNQLTFAVIGVVVAFVASRIRVSWWKRLALPAYAVAVLAQFLVFTSLGVSRLGNQNWIAFGGVTAQPSEFGKLALVLISSGILMLKRKRLLEAKHVVIPLVPVVLLFLALVMMGHDLGTALVLLGIVASIMFVSGIRMRFFAGAAVAAAAAVTVFVMTSGNRTGRIDAWLGSCPTSTSAGCWQRVHGQYALADGGWFGVGLGASREKWSWLPEAHNDFIFAVIGEELGLPGTLTVLALYAAIAYACYRLIATSKDYFVRLATTGVMTWILLQALVNIASVIGLLPIIGVPLPLISSGGSALVMNLLGLGMVLSFARNEPECKAALAQRPRLVARTRAVLPTGRRGQ
ncbi:putative lipid II flippase FtsW [Calidifontibacter terrae]